MDNLVTCDLIINWLKEQVEQKLPVPPHTWLEAAAKMTVLMSDENNKLFELQKKVAEIKMFYIEKGDSVAKARVKTETTDSYLEMKKQEAKVEQITELVRIAKLQARTADNEWRAQS